MRRSLTQKMQGNFFSVCEHVLDFLTLSHSIKNIPGKIYFPINDEILRGIMWSKARRRRKRWLWMGFNMKITVNSICYMLFSIHPRLFSHQQQHHLQPESEGRQIPFNSKTMANSSIVDEDTELSLGINWFSSLLVI
jgi:hypothetical protein